MAGCAAVPEVSDTDHADHRAVRSYFEAVLADGQTFRQYHGGSHDGPWTGVGDLRDSEARTGDQRLDDNHSDAVRPSDKCAGTACCIHTGLRFHYALGGLYRHVPAGWTLTLSFRATEGSRGI